MDVDTGPEVTAPISERLGLDGIIAGIANDLTLLRAGHITVEDARVRADLAKQILSGIRLFVSTQRFLDQSAKLIAPPQGGEG